MEDRQVTGGAVAAFGPLAAQRGGERAAGPGPPVVVRAEGADRGHRVPRREPLRGEGEAGLLARPPNGDEGHEREGHDQGGGEDADHDDMAGTRAWSRGFHSQSLAWRSPRLRR